MLLQACDWVINDWVIKPYQYELRRAVACQSAADGQRETRQIILLFFSSLCPQV